MTKPIKLAVLLFVLSETNFFLLLICAYVFYHRPGGLGPSAANSLNVLRTAFFSVALFASSATVWRAGVNLEQGRRTRSAAWLLATIALGVVFLAGQGAEYLELLREHVTISRNLFGTTFFTLTGFHGLHVLVGLVLLTILLILATSKDPRGPVHPAMDGISIYWHFVDAVWVFIFSIVYLWRFV